ncbi:WD40-repeat-containing domain protein [Tirmania nivea]|nr:WD40-repeat-containing domain protein [Tirmania nivea]
MVVGNKFRFMEKLQATMSTMVEKIASCEFYAGIYQQRRPILVPNTQGVDNDPDTDLRNLYTAVQAFLDKAMDYIERGKTGTGKFTNLFQSFSVTMEPLIENIRDKEEVLKKYAWMATIETIKALPGSIQKLDSDMGQIQENLLKLDEIRTVWGKMVERFSAMDLAQELRPQPREIISFDSELQMLKSKDLSEFEALKIFQTDLYVTARGMSTPQAPESSYFNLADRLREFLSPNSPQKVCLIQGAAGLGKSTFNHFLATRLWEEYDQAIAASEDAIPPIPIFVTLARLHDPNCHNQDLISKLFKRHNWPEERIWKAKQHLQFVFILDGYDEIENQQGNFYDTNGLKDWQAKTVITSRPEYLGRGYQWKFYPQGQPKLLQEYWLAPFSINDIHEYIRKYVEMVNTTDTSGSEAARSIDDYKELMENKGVRALISNPFLLKMVMTLQRTDGSTDFKRVKLYQRFLDHWLNGAHKRLSAVIQVPSNKREALGSLCDQDFVGQAREFCLSFAVELYRHKTLEASYTSRSQYGLSTRRLTPEAKAGQETWKKFLGIDDSSQELLRRSSPLIRVGQTYRFLHKSLRDFAVAQSMLQDQALSAPDSLLNEFHVVEDHGIIDFIVEEAQQNEELQAQLLACVEDSKQNPEIAKAAANAITVLVRAGKRFHEHDLRGIRIPRADIRSGWFERAQLQGADLSGVRLDRIWLRGANLTGADIDGGEFGEKPYFTLEGSRLLTCFYTSDSELLVASYNCDNVVQVWSATNRKLLHTFRGHIYDVTCAAFPPNGDPDLFALARIDGTILLWSRQHQEAPFVHNLYMDRVHSITFSPGANFLAAGGEDNVVYLWSIATPYHTRCFSCSNTRVYTIAFSPDGRTLALAGNRDLVELRSTWNGEVLKILRNKTTPRAGNRFASVAFAPNGKILASAGWDRSLKLWLVSDGQLIYSFTGHAGGIQTIAFTPDSKMIAAAANDSTVRIWSVASLELVHIIEQISLRNSNLTFSRDSELIATGDTDGVIRQRLVPREMSGSVRVRNGHTNAVNDFAFSYDKKLLVSASHYEAAHLWSIDPPHMPNLVNVLVSPRKSSILAIAFSPDSVFLVTHDINKVHLYRSFQDKTSSSQDSMLGSHNSFVRAAAITTDGSIVASADDDGEIHLWSIQSGTKIHTLQGHTDTIYVIDFSPDGQLLVSGNSDSTVRLWSVPRCELLHTFKGHTNWVRHVAFSPDGEAIASASDDKTVRLWSVPDHKCLHIFQGHTNYVTRVSFSPDGFLLASGSRDKTMRFWSLSSRALLLNIDIQTEVTALTWTGSTPAADGLIAIGIQTGGVQLLQVIQKPGYSKENPAMELSWFWATDNGAYLNVVGARIAGVTGLNPTNIELLKQRGAIGKPAMGRVQEVEEETEWARR